MEHYVYTAFRTFSPLHTELKGHVTTSFSQIKDTMPKIPFSGFDGTGEVIGIEHFKDADVTVALINCDGVISRHAELMASGLEYEYELMPHITLCRGGDSSDRYAHLVGATVNVGSEYIGFMTRT